MTDTDEASTANEPVRVAFVCVQNAGRSQMATAFAERERTERNLEDVVTIRTGGTDPAAAVHDVVVEVMQEVGYDLTDRIPRAIPPAELAECTYVCTMGCSTLELGVDPAEVSVRDWALADPDGQPIERVRSIRDTVQDRVRALFDDIEQQHRERP